MENTEYMKDPEFLNWLDSIGFDKKALQDQINNDDYARLDDLILRFNDHNSQEENNFMSFSQGKPGDGNVPTNDLDAYYKNWCEKEHNPPYVYENTNEASPAYGMKYYKTQEDKNADKPAARALYSDAKHVDVECSDDKGPDYEFLDALVRKAAIDGQPGINFEEGMTPEFANKLAAACIKYGLKMKGQPTNIDIHEFEDQLTAEQKANIEKYNKGEVTSDYIASLFRHKDDYSIAKIMADADLKGVSEEFYNTYADALNIEKQMPVSESLYKINSTGQLVFTSKIIKDNLIPTVEHNGSVYKVIDFTKMSKSADLSQYGFTPGTTVDSARFYVHMADSAENLETVDCLSDVANGSFLCASYISTGNKNTYNNSKFGVSLEAENVNIANAANENQCSGGHKGFDIFSEIISGNDDQLSHYRDTIPTRIKNQLHLNEREYAELYQMFASKKHISQIKDNEIYTVGRKTLRGDRIKKAIQTAGNDLFSPDSHNESNLYNPKINAFVAKVNSIEEIPESFLKFVQKHNLPIYLLGE